MTTATKFQVRDSNGTVETCDTLRDAVLAAAREDGYGAVYQRDENGAMCLYSSRNHIGNNIYFPQDSDSFPQYSLLPDDASAEIDVAAKIYKTGVFHSRHNLDIVELTFVDGTLAAIDGKTLEQLVEDWDIPAEDIRGIYQ